ncbi:PREDICTED: protein SRC2 isoform X2 [Tarenaya hassleriana]|uniref:protein SRC2 isoform X3 n=1 Tax=Tarenaya hassleriana TaxID=28532 RepID=UPI00053C656C|nr:PREDICTED: protein SRC2 isoform X3 [Tarenaya hassleriana]XP_010548936.1 PREDICTED: protein SRC2 isoform X1 [Tarenaya hassleriana]XP_019058849.1 PREDICTED: protein SRC2 isoform X2 [Tarenaya hassleriana]
MANLTLELNIYSAKDLENVNIITKMDAYAVVSIHGDDTQKNLKMKTPIDRSGGSNPTWNHAVKFSANDRLVRDGRLTLVVKLVCDRVLGDKEIGEVNVPVLELIGSNPPSPSTNGNGMKFVTYQVRTPSGRGKGSLTFSYRFDSGPVKSDLPAPPVYTNPATSDLPVPVYPPPPPVSAYPSPPSQPQFGYPPPDQPQPYPDKPVSLYPDPGKLGEPVKLDESVTAYPPQPTGSSWVPPVQFGEPFTTYPPPPTGPPPAYGTPQYHPYAYPPLPPEKPGHAYYHAPPPHPSYAYVAAPPPPGSYGYGYPPPPPPLQRKNKPGLGLGAGLLGGALGGLLIGDIVSDVADIGFDF